jgi:membrane fusion protein, multidrug efflux system
LAGGVVVLAAGGYFFVPRVVLVLTTVSTDDAYVNSHVTFVAARVPGQVARVLVDDNNRVRKGDLIVRLDKEPYQVQVDMKKAAIATAEADLAAARAQARGIAAQGRSQRWKLQHAIEDVDRQVALLRQQVATLGARKATLVLARGNYQRGRQTVGSGAMSQESYEGRREAVAVADAQVTEALESIYQTRVNLGLPAKPEKGDDLTQVPPDLDQTFSSVRVAQAQLLQTAAQLGIVPSSYGLTPKRMLEEFHRRTPSGSVDVIYDQLVKDAPAVRQAEAKLLVAHRDLDQAKLNLRYCDILAEIDGVITGRNVNPGNNVQAGQSLMAVRSLTEIWIDANFKETQLADLRIGQRVRCEVDMYGGRRTFDGRITGFTMGTGQTLALLPPQNATGNFVKIVQRLPVRIELTDYDPDKVPLFVGLSVAPYVYYREPPKGPHAGDLLQPLAALPKALTGPRP